MKKRYVSSLTSILTLFVTLLIIFAMFSVGKNIYIEMNKCDKCSFDDGVVTLEATCEKNGVIKYTCKKCEYSYEEEIQPLSHEYIIIKENAPTCTIDGSLTMECIICGDLKREILSKDNCHLFDTLNSELIYEAKSCQEVSEYKCYCTYGCGATQIVAEYGNCIYHYNGERGFGYKCKFCEREFVTLEDYDLVEFCLFESIYDNVDDEIINDIKTYSFITYYGLTWEEWLTSDIDSDNENKSEFTVMGDYIHFKYANSLEPVQSYQLDFLQYTNKNQIINRYLYEVTTYLN